MQADLTLVILPGMDGTGILLGDIRDNLQNHFKVIVVDYPSHLFLDYEQLLSYVTGRLPRERFVLIGESFSGPLALKIAAMRPPGLQGVVLAASFARLDYPFKRALRFAVGKVSHRSLPNSVLSFLLLGRWATRDKAEALGAVLSTIPSNVISRRALASLDVDLIAESVLVVQPVLYLRARHDALIPPSAALAVAEVCSDMRLVDIDGPHFILQAAVEASASSIRKFTEDLSLG